MYIIKIPVSIKSRFTVDDILISPGQSHSWECWWGCPGVTWCQLGKVYILHYLLKTIRSTEKISAFDILFTCRAKFFYRSYIPIFLWLPTLITMLDHFQRPEDLWAVHSRPVFPKPHKRSSSCWIAIQKVSVCVCMHTHTWWMWFLLKFTSNFFQLA